MAAKKKTTSIWSARTKRGINLGLASFPGLLVQSEEESLKLIRSQDWFSQRQQVPMIMDVLYSRFLDRIEVLVGALEANPHVAGDALETYVDLAFFYLQSSRHLGIAIPLIDMAVRKGYPVDEALNKRFLAWYSYQRAGLTDPTFGHWNRDYFFCS